MTCWNLARRQNDPRIWGQMAVDHGLAGNDDSRRDWDEIRYLQAIEEKGVQPMVSLLHDVREALVNRHDAEKQSQLAMYNIELHYGNALLLLARWIVRPSGLDHRLSWSITDHNHLPDEAFIRAILLNRDPCARLVLTRTTQAAQLGYDLFERRQRNFFQSMDSIQYDVVVKVTISCQEYKEEFDTIFEYTHNE